jgi:hypothetical protein
MLEADACDMAVKGESFRQQFLIFVAVRQMAAVKQSGKIVSDDRIPLCGKNCTR